MRAINKLKTIITNELKFKKITKNEAQVFAVQNRTESFPILIYKYHNLSFNFSCALSPTATPVK